VLGELADDVSETAVGPLDSGPVKMGPTAVSETSSANSPYTPCKTPKPKYQYSSHGESLKSRCVKSSSNSNLVIKRVELLRNYLIWPRNPFATDKFLCDN
jgi:hypothetical protein